MKRRINCSLIGFPDHEGVRNVGGRLGASAGPEAFRKVWGRIKGRDALPTKVIDRGDSSVQNLTLEEKYHEAMKLTLDQHIEWPSISVAVGGGHDYAYPHLKGVKEALLRKYKKPRLGCINLDAHFDLRAHLPLMTSGSPFRRLIEEGILDPKHLVEFGVQAQSNAPELFEYAESKKVKTLLYASMREGRAVVAFKKALKELEAKVDALAFSVDLDAMAEAYAPGVSAPQSEGFTSMELCAFAEIAGQSRKTISLGLYELSPAHDVGDRTARLAATCAHRFLEGKL